MVPLTLEYSPHPPACSKTYIHTRRGLAKGIEVHHSLSPKWKSRHGGDGSGAHGHIRKGFHAFLHHPRPETESPRHRCAQVHSATMTTRAPHEPASCRVWHLLQTPRGQTSYVVHHMKWRTRWRGNAASFRAIEIAMNPPWLRRGFGWYAPLRLAG